MFVLKYSVLSAKLGDHLKHFVNNDEVKSCAVVMEVAGVRAKLDVKHQEQYFLRNLYV